MAQQRLWNIGCVHAIDDVNHDAQTDEGKIDSDSVAVVAMESIREHD